MKTINARSWQVNWTAPTEVESVDFYVANLASDGAGVGSDEYATNSHPVVVIANSHGLIRLYSNKGVLRYFEPSSGSTATIVLPFPSSFAFLSVTYTIAAALIPMSKPSSLAIFLASSKV